MSDKVKKTFSKIRTFASDMDKVRRKHEKISNQKKDESAPKKEKGKELNFEMSAQKPAAGKHTTKQSPEQIPAFHELKTETKELNIEKEKEVKEKKKKIGEKVKAPQTNIVYGATVITDTKKNKTKLIPSIFRAVKKWFKEITKPKKKKVPKYTIPETSHRKGVIQKATSKTGSIFTADNETIKEQIRKRHFLEESKEKIEEDNQETEELEASWSPYTETGFNLLEEPEKVPDVTQNVKIDFKKQTTLPLEKQVDSSNKDSIEEEKEEREKEVTPALINTNKEDPEKKKEEEEEKEQQKIELFSIKNEEDNKLGVNTLTIIVLTLVVTTVLLLFSSQISFKSPDSKETPSSSIETLLKNSSLEKVTLSSETIDTLPQLIKLQTESTDENFSETVVTSVSGTEIRAAYLMEILGFKTLPSLNKSITNIRFVTTKETNKLLLIKFVDKTTVLGGLLQWEPSLADDLQTLFSLPSVKGEFRDKTLGNISFREFVNVDTNETIVLYGIIDENTLVITTSEKVLEEIIKTEFSY